MHGKNKKIILVGFILVVSVFICLNFVSAVFADCWAYSGTSSNTCTTSGGSSCIWKTQAQDPWCYDSVGCCIGERLLGL